MTLGLPRDPSWSDYFKLMELHNTNRIDYNDRKWEGVKFFEGVFTIFIAATVAAIVALERDHLWSPLLLRAGVAVLPAIGALSAIIGQRNLRRESRLLFMEEVQVFKLARFLGLDQELAEGEQWLPGDEHLLLRKWRSHAYGTKRHWSKDAEPSLEKWLDARMRGHRFVDLVGILFYAEAGLAFALAVLILVHY